MKKFAEYINEIKTSVALQNTSKYISSLKTKYSDKTKGIKPSKNSSEYLKDIL